jgi:hypothetical protein
MGLIARPCIEIHRRAARTARYIDHVGGLLRRLDMSRRHRRLTQKRKDRNAIRPAEQRAPAESG